MAVIMKICAALASLHSVAVQYALPTMEFEPRLALSKRKSAGWAPKTQHCRCWPVAATAKVLISQPAGGRRKMRSIFWFVPPAGRDFTAVGLKPLPAKGIERIFIKD